MNPVDQTGYGPTSRGSAPSPWEARNVAAQRRMTDKLGDAMSYSDPATVDYAMSALRLKTGVVDPQQLRQMLYNTKEGQAMLDTAQIVRNKNFLNQGSQLNAAANFTNLVAGGGFSANILDHRGNVLTTNRVTGTGILSERMALQVQDQFMNSIGASNSGFNRTDMSELYMLLNQKSGLGNMVSLIPNATVDQRFASMRESSTADVRAQLAEFGADPTRMRAFREAEARFKADTTGTQGGREALNEFLSGVSDPKLRESLNQAARSTDAMQVDTQKLGQSMKVAKEMSKSVAAIAEVYPSLQSMFERLSKLTTITGMSSFNDPATAKRALNTVNNLIAATPSGMSSQAWLDTVANSNAEWRQRFYTISGLDERANSAIIAASAAQNNRWNVDAVTAEQVQATAQKTLAGNGFRVGARKYSEVLADRQQGGTAFMTKRKGIVMLVGAIESGFLSPERQAQAEEILKAYESATSAQEKASIDSRAKSFVAYDGDVSNVETSGVGERLITLGSASSRANNYANDEMTDSLYTKYLTDATKSESLSRSLIRSMGSGGMAQLSELRKNPDKSSMRQFMKQHGMSDTDIDQFMVVGSSDAEFGRIAALVQSTDRGDVSVFSQRAAAENRLNARGKHDFRKVVDNKSSIAAIADAFFNGKLKNEEEALPLIAEALQREGIKLDGTFTSGLNVRGGVGDDMLNALTKATGLSVGEIAKKTGFGSVEELKAKTKEDTLALDKFLNAASEMPGVSITGTTDSMNVMDDKMVESLDMEKREKQLRMIGALKTFRPGLNEGELSGEMKRILAGGEANFNVGEADAFEKGGWFGIGQTDKMVNLLKSKNMAKSINDATNSELQGLIELDVNGTVLKNLTGTRDAMRTAMEDGVTEIDTVDPSTGETKTTSVNAVEIEAITKAIERLQGRSEGDMTVSSVTINGEVTINGKLNNNSQSP